VPEAVPESAARVEPPPAPEPAPAAPPPPRPEPVAEPAIVLTAEELLSAYMLNDAAAHQKFTNKTLKVTGTVGKVTVADSRAVYSVFLTAPQIPGFRDVECRFSRQHSAIIGKLKPGQNVTIEGKYFGYVINIVLRNCTLAG
jgi:hypothetical protein